MLALRPYQKSIMDSIYESMKSGHRRPLVCAPCGSGKTVIFTDLAERTQAKGKTVAVLVHRRELMRQTKDTFHRAGVGRELVQIHMAQTFSRHLVEYERPDLIITDEAHFFSGSDMAEDIRSLAGIIRRWIFCDTGPA